MKVWVIRKELEGLKEMQDEGRTRTIEISSFRRFEDDREIAINI